MIQKKIDHIGEFKFRVRGWSLTLQSGLIAAAVAGKISEPETVLPYLGFGIATLVVIGLFHFLEQEKDFLSTALGERAIVLERAIDELTVQRDWSDFGPNWGEVSLAKALAAVESSPRVAVLLRKASQKSIEDTFKAMLRRHVYRFYIIQYILTVLAMAAFCSLHITKHGLDPVPQAATAIVEKK